MLEFYSLALESHKQSDVFPFHQDVNANDPSSSHCLVPTELCLDSVTTRTAVSRIFVSSSVAYPNSSSVDPKTSSIDPMTCLIDPTSESLDQQRQETFGPILDTLIPVFDLRPSSIVIRLFGIRSSDLKSYPTAGRSNDQSIDRPQQIGFQSSLNLSRMRIGHQKSTARWTKKGLEKKVARPLLSECFVE
jgi:hypothetical protein